LGLFLFVLNGLCLWLTSLLVPGFVVHGFWSAVFGALIVSVVSWLLTAFVSDRGQVVVITRSREGKVERRAGLEQPISGHWHRGCSTKTHDIQMRSQRSRARHCLPPVCGLRRRADRSGPPKRG